MARIIFILLIFAVVNKQTASFSILGIDFNDIKNVYDYVNTLYGKGVDYANKDEIEKNDVQNQLRQIMDEMRDMSEQLTNFVSHQDEKMDRVVKILLNNIEVIGDFRSIRTEFVQCIDNVEFWFNKGMEFQENTGYTIQTIKNFIRSASYERLCDKYISPQQQFYYIFMHLIRIQLKAFTTVTQAYSMQSAFNHVNFTQEYKVFKQIFDQRLTNYVESFVHFMAAMPADIRRCDVENPVIGKNYYEMEGLFQVLVNYESKIKRSVFVQGTPFCGNCEEIKNHYYYKYMIHSCKTYTSISGCPTSELSDDVDKVRYSYFTADSENYGHTRQCNHSLYGINRYFGSYWCLNDICVCSVNVTNRNFFPKLRWGIHIDPPKLMKISVAPQYSDIANNMLKREQSIHVEGLTSHSSGDHDNERDTILPVK
ncbi:hypothetical protein PV327_008998 [Microctonus hyperodae]|uniref:Uncharacterized protein n=1 Tax=Microctonus hyperodae TaxID=165561 RepID=A0AA39FSV0_MICHY|nr:hypothetical protein PV327_008998 [Microctonus hyperodae]